MFCEDTELTFSSKRSRSYCTYLAGTAPSTLSSKPVHSVLDTATLILGIDALFKYVVSDFGEVWLLLELPQYVLAFDSTPNCL